MTDKNLTHVNESGTASMVDVSEKDVTFRKAIASAKVSMQPETLTAVRDNTTKKGDVLAVARIAGIQAAKKCSDLIPLCHPLALSGISVDFDLDEAASEIHITTSCKLNGRTGVEMEALTAASVAALTIYDMCKAMEKSMVISDVKLLEKEGGKSGVWKHD